MKFDLLYLPTMRWLFTIEGLGPRRSGVEVDADQVRIWMGWGFSARIPRNRIARVTRSSNVWWAIGIHRAFGRRWIVNGSPRNIVTLQFDRPYSARFWFIPVKMLRLSISLVQPDAFIETLAPAH